MRWKGPKTAHRHFPWLLGLLGVLLVPYFSRLVLADCCDPTQQWGVSGIVTYLWTNGDLQYSSGQSDETDTIATAWNQLFANLGYDAKLVKAQSTQPAWTIQWSFSVAPWALTDVNSHTIFIHPSVMNGDWSWFQHIISHELGHVLGWGHGNCTGNQSVMAVNQPTDSFLPYPAGCEQLFINHYYFSWCLNGGCTPGYTHDISLCGSAGNTDECGCCFNETPLLVHLSGDGFEMSGLDKGVIFDVNGLHHLYKLGWPLTGDNAWLARDRNGDGAITNGSELFGNSTRLRGGGVAQNGFQALADLDSNGDGWIDRRDPAYHEIVLWRDLNRNGRSDPGELTTLENAGVVAISTAYRESRWRDRWGNQFRYRGEILFNSRPERRVVVDVYPVWEKIEAPACTSTKMVIQTATVSKEK